MSVYQTVPLVLVLLHVCSLVTFRAVKSREKLYISARPSAYFPPFPLAVCRTFRIFVTDQTSSLWKRLSLSLNTPSLPLLRSSRRRAASWARCTPPALRVRHPFRGRRQVLFPAGDPFRLRGAFRPVRLVHRQPDRLQQPPDHRHGLVRERELGGLHVQARFRQLYPGDSGEQASCRLDYKLSVIYS